MWWWWWGGYSAWMCLRVLAGLGVDVCSEGSVGLHDGDCLCVDV